jgi:predicted RNA methylase
MNIHAPLNNALREMIMINTTESDTWKETNHGLIMSESISDLQKINFFKNKNVLELGGGSANHTKLILENEPNLLVTTEINKERLEITKKKVEEHLGKVSNCKFIVADWLDVSGTFDIVITNPPYFVSGKYNRRYFIDELILNSYKRLLPSGYLLFVQSSMADIALTENRMVENGYQFEIIKEQTFKWRDYYSLDPSFIKMCDNKPGSYFMKDGDRWETLYVVQGMLKPYKTHIFH